MTSVSTESTIPTEQIPYFVIQGNECFLSWLVKRILLIFQCCIAQETVNTYIAVFSQINIRWLTQSQIVELQDEKIQQLGIEQLLAFTQVQISYFTNSQRAAFEGSLRQYFEMRPSEESIESVQAETEVAFQQPSITDTSLEHPVNDVLRGEVVESQVATSLNGSTIIRESDQAHIESPVAASVEPVSSVQEGDVIATQDALTLQSTNPPLTESDHTSIERHVEDPIVNISLMDELNDARASTISSKDTFEAQASSAFTKPVEEKISPDSTRRPVRPSPIVIRNTPQTDRPEILSDRTLQGYLSMPVDKRAPYLQALSEEERQLITHENAIRALPNWKNKCRYIHLDNLGLLRLMFKPYHELSRISMSSIPNLDRREAAYLSLRLNNWLTNEPITVIDRIYYKHHFEEAWELLWLELQEKGVELSGLLIDLPASEGEVQGELEAENANHIISVCNIDNRDPLEPISTDIQVVIDANLESTLNTLGDFENLTTQQFANLSAHKIHQFLRTLRDMMLEVHDEPPLSDELSIDDLTLEQFRCLSCERINSMLENLPPNVIALLSEPQLEGLDTGKLSQPQVDALIAEATVWSDNVKLKKVFELFSTPQVVAMESKLPARVLQRISLEHLRAIDTTHFTQERVNHLINQQRGDFLGAAFTRFTLTQIRNMQDRLTGEALRGLDEERMRALDAEAITQEQVDGMLNWCSTEQCQTFLSRFSESQIPHLQGKLSGYTLKLLTTELTRALNVQTLEEDKVQSMLFFTNQEDLEPQLAKFTSEQIVAMQSKIPGSTLRQFPEAYIRMLDAEELTQDQVNSMLNNWPMGRVELLRKFLPEQIEAIRSELDFGSLRDLATIQAV